MLELNDRDIVAIYKVLDKAIHTAEECFNNNRHARMMYLQLQQYLLQKIKDDHEFKQKYDIEI